MKYKLRGKIKGSLLETILSNRGISDLNRIINPNNSSDTNPDNIPELKLAVELVKRNLDKKILLLVDSDCDGMTSSAIIYKYLTYINPYIDIDYYLHDGKRHGLTNDFMKFINDKHYDLIIVPDAGSNDVENIEMLELERKTKVLVLDHHEIDKFTSLGLIINNRVIDNINKNLTGAGMALLFCKAMELTYRTGILDELSNLAMIGQIGDSSDVLEDEVRNLCMSSIRNIENNFIKEVYKDNGKDIYGLTIKDLSFGGVIPMINSVTRVGTVNDKQIVFEALADINPERTWTVSKRKLNKEIRKYEIVDFKMDLYQFAIEICKRCRDKQNKMVQNVIKKLEDQYSDKSDIQIFIMNDEDAKGITGLIGNKLADQFGKPSIVCWLDDNGFYKGSLRGNTKVLADFKEWCLGTGLFEFVQGHANAAGILFKDENLEKIIEKTYNIESTGFVYDVDYIFNYIPSEEINQICQYSSLWDNGVEKPLFAMENIQVPTSSISWSKNTMRIWMNGVTLIKFKTPEEEVNKLKESNGYINLNLIGEFEINEWQGRQYSQIIIKDYEKNENNTINYGIFR